MKNEKEQSNLTDQVSPAEMKRQKNVLRRLQTLIDVVYGLMIFRLFILLPHPTPEQLATRDFIGMFAESGTSLIIILIGIVLIIIYWGQSNIQLGYLTRVDTRIATLSIIQVFSLLIYLYFTRLDNQSDGDEFTLLFESIFLAIAGFVGIYSWNYSWKKKYFSKDLSEAEAIEIANGFYAEPVVAAITIPLAFIGTTYYTIGWLLLIPVGIILKRRKNRKLEELRSK